MSYKFEIPHCPICGRPIADNWYIRHIREVHGDDLTESHKQSIRDSVERAAHYSWVDFQWEQHVDS